MTGAALGLQSIPFSIQSNPLQDIIKIGIIRLDTSHAPAFAKLFNSENTNPASPDLKWWRLIRMEARK